MARLVGHLSRAAHQAVEEHEGITLSQMTLMGQIRGLGGSARMVDLARRIQLSKAAVTKLVDTLQRRGYLEREPDPNDRRVIRATLTPPGNAALERADTVFERVMQDGLWRHLSTAETKDIVAVLERLQQELGLARNAVMPRNE